MHCDLYLMLHGDAKTNADYFKSYFKLLSTQSQQMDICSFCIEITVFHCAAVLKEIQRSRLYW